MPPRQRISAPDRLPASLPPARSALLAQAGASLAVATLVYGLGYWIPFDPRPLALLLALLQGALAAIIALAWRAPRWWIPIHLAFMPLALTVLQLDIAPGWYLAAFVLLLLVFWRTDQSRVPLYLTNRATAAALLRQLPTTACRVIDLGCGDAGLLRRLAVARPDCRFVGIEHAPLTWLLARLRTAGLPNVRLRRGDLWQENLSGHDIAYAFLSPVPMAQLWQKACAEMPPGARLISNSFAIPGVRPDGQVDVNDRRGTRLYLYCPVPH